MASVVASFHLMFPTMRRQWMARYFRLLAIVCTEENPVPNVYALMGGNYSLHSGPTELLSISKQEEKIPLECSGMMSGVLTLLFHHSMMCSGEGCRLLCSGDLWSSWSIFTMASSLVTFLSSPM